MRNAVLSLLAGTAFFTVAAVPAHARLPATGLQTELTVPHVAGQLVVGLAPGVDASILEDLLVAFGAVVLAEHSPGRLAVVGLDSDDALAIAREIVTADSRVEFAELNYLYATDATPNDIDFTRQWSKNNTGVNAPMGLGTPGADLNLVEAWDTRTDASDVVVAIIDDSVDTTHIDLVANLSTGGKCFASPNSSRPCANGPDDPNPSGENEFHGTLVAGTAGASGNNGIGIAGTAWTVTLLPLKVDLSSFAIASAVDEAIAQGADIINMSFGGPVQSTAQSAALDRAESAGLLVVASAGNADANNDIALHFPSDSTQSNVLSIAATDARDNITSFSQWGPSTVHLAAPGELILTTANDSQYASASGTSFSAPHVAGVAALIKAETGAANYKALKAHLLYGGVNGVGTIGPVVPGQDQRAVPGRVATGRLDAARALTGPTGGVLLINDVTIDDATTGNGNNRLDPGETASIQITLRNHWLTESGVTASLSTPDSGLLTVNDVTPVLYGAISQDSTATAQFSVTLSAAATGNEQLFLELTLNSTAGALPARYAYLETGTLQNGQTVTAAIQRWNWDEFQAWHVDVPPGSSNLVVATSGSGDVDLLLRHARMPEYLITLNAEQRGVQGFYYVDRDTQVSADAGSNESLTIANPLPGTYHAVVVNYDQAAKNYDLTASFTTAGADIISFTDASYGAFENGGTRAIAVTRSGGPTAASVNFATAAGSATAGADYVETSGTLNWAAGESGTKTFEVEIIDDDTAESSETVMLSLSGASGALLGPPANAELSIEDNDGVQSFVAFAQSDHEISESGGSLELIVQRTGSTVGQVSVDYETRGLNALAGSDFEDARGTLNWTDGDSAPKTITVLINDDQAEESMERFSVALLRPGGANLGNVDEAFVTIEDDDSVTPPPPAPSGGSGGGGLGVVCVALLLTFGLHRRRYDLLPT